MWFPAYHKTVSAFPCCSTSVENIIISRVEENHFSSASRSAGHPQQTITSSEQRLPREMGRKLQRLLMSMIRLITKISLHLLSRGSEWRHPWACLLLLSLTQGTSSVQSPELSPAPSVQCPLCNNDCAAHGAQKTARALQIHHHGISEGVP